jgi:hypothetical protein
MVYHEQDVGDGLFVGLQGNSGTKIDRLGAGFEIM